MSRLRETLDDLDKTGSPTRVETNVNRYKVRCSVCDGMFYVDETTYNRARHAVEFDPADNPFCCDDCEQEYDEEALF